MPKPTASASGSVASASSTTSTIRSSTSCRSAPAPQPVHAMVHGELLVDHAAEQLRAPRRRSPPLALRPCSDAIHPGWPSGPPTSPNTRSTARGAGCSTACRGRATRSPSCARRRAAARSASARTRTWSRSASAPRSGPLWRRILKWVAIAVGAWLLLSFVLFMVSAQITDGVSDETEEALSSGGSLLTGSTILVLGSDERPEGHARARRGGLAGARRQHPADARRARLGAASSRSCATTPADIPGHGAQKINAAYAFGGAPLMIETVEAVTSATGSRSTTSSRSASRTSPSSSTRSAASTSSSRTASSRTRSAAGACGCRRASTT